MAGAGATIRTAPIRATGRSTTILLDRLDPATLGALIAFYEHRTFANAALLGINPFDQFGVELGKEMAQARRPRTTELRPVDAALIERAGLSSNASRRRKMASERAVLRQSEAGE